MANDDWDDDSNANVPQALRDHAKKLKQDLEEERAKNATLSAQVRTSAISSVLADKGYNPKIAALIPEAVEASAEKLEAWLGEHAELFPKMPVQPSGGANEPPADDGDDDDTSGDDRMGRAISMGLPLDRAKDVETRLQSAKTPEELDKIMGSLSHVRFK